MYIYAELCGTIHRFRTMSWVEWLNHLKKGGSKTEIDRFATSIGLSEGDMLDWEDSDIDYAFEKLAERAAERKRKRRTG